MPDPMSQTPHLADVLRSRLSGDDLDHLRRLFSARDGAAQNGDLWESGAANGSMPASDPRISGPRTSESEYGAILSRVLPNLMQERRRFANQRDDAGALLTELLGHPQERRIVLIRNSQRFISWPLCEALLESSLDACFRDHKEAVELCTLAVEIALHLADTGIRSPLVHDLQARSYSYLGNALRVSSDLDAADQAFERASELLEQGTGDLLELARHLSMKAVNCASRRRFDESFSHYRRATRIYRQCGEMHLYGRTLMQLAIHLGAAGETDQGIELLRKSLTLIDVDREPRLAYAAVQNLIFLLNEAGEYQEAYEHLQRNRAVLASQDDPVSLLRLRWLEGLVMRGTGEEEEAELALVEARQAFETQGLVYEFAMVTMDLSMLYIAQGRTTEIKQLAQELVPVTQSKQLRDQGIAALILFQKAAELEKISLDLVRQTISSLRQLRQDR
ncbi:MAG: hypothetical protein AAGD01_12510 [Acidobacteriota bacterium]